MILMYMKSVLLVLALFLRVFDLVVATTAGAVI